MLDVTDLHVYYGEIHALKGISFRVPQGEIVPLLGNNGAGKTTTLRTLPALLAAGGVAGGAALRDGPGDQAAGRHHPAGGAERSDGPVHRRAGLRARDGPPPARRRGARAGRQSGSAPRLPGRGLSARNEGETRT